MSLYIDKLHLSAERMLDAACTAADYGKMHASEGNVEETEKYLKTMNLALEAWSTLERRARALESLKGESS